MASKDLQPFTEGPLKLILRSQFGVTPQSPPPGTSLSGQTALITGSNIGIGLECARLLLDLNLSHLIMAVRSAEKGEKAAAPLRKTHPTARIEVWTLDMLSYESIQVFTERCSTSLQRLDIAILNAGSMQTPFVINQSTGHEVMFQTNYLSTALLTMLLLPVLKSKSPPNTPGRLTIVGSGLGLISKFPNHGAVPLFPSFDDPKGWNVNAATERYSVTKTLLMMLVLKLSEQVDPEDVIVNVVDPGFTKGSGLHRHLSAPLRAFMWIMKVLTARSLEAGAWMYVDAAVVKGKESHGCFVMDWSIYPYHPLLYKPEGKQTTERLWEETLDELQFAKVRDNVSTLSQ